MQYFIERVRNQWPFLLGLGLGLYFITFNIIGKSFSYYPGNLIDARFNTYILEHSYKVLIKQDQSLWNAPFMYPEDNVISYSDNLLGTAIFYIPFRLIGMDRETSFQCWFILITFLNYAFSYLFLYLLFKDRYAAVLGAIIFAFSMALQYHLLHAQTFTRFPIPLAFLMCTLFSKDLKAQYFFGALFSLVYQFFCGIYLGLLLLIPVCICLILCIVFKRSLFISKIKDLRWVTSILGASLINIILLLLFMYPYYLRSKTLDANEYSIIAETIPTLKSYFSSLRGSLFWDFLSQNTEKGSAWFQNNKIWGHELFPGVIPIVSLLCILITITKRTFYKDKIFNDTIKVIQLLLLTGLITSLFFIRFEEFSGYRLIFSIPGFSSMRMITRIINIQLIFFSIATTFFFYYLFKKLKGKIIVFLFIISLIFIIADNYYHPQFIYRTAKSETQARVNNLVEEMKTFPKNAIVSYEPIFIDRSPEVFHLDAMLATQTLNLKCLNGYTSTSPKEFSSYWLFPEYNSRLHWVNSRGVKNNIYIVHGTKFRR